METESSAIATRPQAAAAMSREAAEMRAAVGLAMQYPRDEAAAFAHLSGSCSRPSFANVAMYRFPRGGQQISGLSVQFAREAARCWGNIRYGYRVVEMGDRATTLEGFAYDLQTNTAAVVSMTFRRLVQRKDKATGQTRWMEPDERDLRELEAKAGAIAERNAILKLIPPDVKEDATQEIERTIRKAAAGEIKQDRERTIRSMAAAFLRLGVRTADLDAYLGHPLDRITEEELVELRGIFQAITDGQASPLEIFQPKEAPKPEPQSGPAPAKTGNATQDALAAIMLQEALDKRADLETVADDGPEAVDLDLEAPYPETVTHTDPEPAQGKPSTRRPKA